MAEGANQRTPVCPLCGASGRLPRARFGSRWNGRQFDFLSCTGCGSKFMAPTPSAADLEKIYAQSEYHEVHYGELSPEQFRRSLAVASGFAPSGSRVLDFGCGNGQFLIAATHAGYSATGVELDAATRKAAARNSGCSVVSFEDALKDPLAYGVIHLGDVLEHLPNPLEVVRQLEPLLAPGGIFLTEGPLEENASLVKWSVQTVRFAKSITGRSNYASRAPTHLTRTTAASQRRFFTSRLGHELLEYEVYEDGWPYSVPWREVLRFWRPSTSIRGLIGKTAVGFASAANLPRFSIGNRFVAVSRPAVASHQQS
jgi:2-polyprenyl-3-methyl-5-hydroxy-6-metoxy-1,4-benzoquinol methylase